MSYQRAINGALCFLSVICALAAMTNANPVLTTEVDSAFPTDVPATEIPRDKNPVYNVWEYAYIHDGSISQRNAAVQSHDDNQGNQCLWAIVSCCNAHTNYERDNCFEALGCSGAWFQNLCSDEYIHVANNRVSSMFSGGFGKK